jgi:hypothetical protein
LRPEAAEQRERAQVVGRQRERAQGLGGARVGVAGLEEHAGERVMEQRGVAVRGDRAPRLCLRLGGVERPSASTRSDASSGRSPALRGRVELRQRSACRPLARSARANTPVSQRSGKSACARCAVSSADGCAPCSTRASTRPCQPAICWGARVTTPARPRRRAVAALLRETQQLEPRPGADGSRAADSR